MNEPNLGELKRHSELILSAPLESAEPISATESSAMDATSPFPYLPSMSHSPPSEEFDQHPPFHATSEKLESIDETTSPTTEKDTSKGKKMQQMLKNRVHKGHARISTISKKIGHGVARTGTLRRSNSAPGTVLIDPRSKVLFMYPV
jgi:hypothetical protein